jgi:V8-like Glu-specific endopeptidase
VGIVMSRIALDTREETSRTAFNRFIDIVTDLFRDDPGPGRRLLVRQAGIDSRLRNVDWFGPASTVAGHVVDRLNNYGPLDDRPCFHALGALADYLLTRPEIPVVDRFFLACLIVSKNLVIDPAYLQRLRAQYNCRSGPLLSDSVITERIRNSWDNLLDVDALWGVHYVAQAVARIEVQGEPRGTGFLLGPNLLLTSQHVLPSHTEAQAAYAVFSYQLRPAQGSNAFALDKQFYYGRPEPELDYVVVRVNGYPLGDIAVGDAVGPLSFRELVLTGKHRGHLRCDLDPIVFQQRVNIIQYPGGRDIKAVLTANRVVEVIRSPQARVRYETDTDEGASGSPVLNMKWQVVALHKGTDKESPGYNVGVPIAAILADFQAQATSEPSFGDALRGLQPGF